MTAGKEDRKLGRDFHRTRRGDQERTIGDLTHSFPEPASTSSREERMDRADVAYAALYKAGKIDGPFEYPSVRAARLQREAVAENRPPEMRRFHWTDRDFASSQDEIRMARDPAAILAEEPDGTVAIMESVSDNDAVQGSSTITWLRCDNLEDAQRYIQQVGSEFSQPGPGEDDGVYTLRTIYMKESPELILEVPPSMREY